MQETISKKIQALLSKTVANGCTEEEAAAAIATAQKLMIKYNLDLSDIERESIEYVLKSYDTNKKKINHLTYLAPAVSRFTDTFTYTTKEETVLYCCFGASHDVDFYIYLLEMLDNAIEYQAEQFKKSTYFKRYRKRSGGRVLVNNFKDGLVLRLRQRLDIIKDERLREAGNIDLYNRGKLAEQKFNETYNVELKQGFKSKAKENPNALRQGYKSGDSVNLNRPLNGNTNNTKMLN